MSRFARVVLAGVPLHVVHRGNHGAPTFLDDADRSSYLERLGVRCSKYGLELWAYCLMTNHVHLLVLPRHKSALAKVIAGVHQGHAERLNLRLERTGHLWQNRYYSTVLDERHLWTAVKYIEKNPVRAGLARRAEDYRWSSARAHCGLAVDPHLSDGRPFPGHITHWRDWLGGEDCEVAAIAALRENSRTGWPTGSPDFIETLEGRLGRCLTRQAPGRPRSEERLREN